MEEDYLKSLLENSAQHKAPKDLKKAVLMAIEKGVEYKKERPQNGISIHDHSWFWPFIGWAVCVYASDNRCNGGAKRYSSNGFENCLYKPICVSFLECSRSFHYQL